MAVIFAMAGSAIGLGNIWRFPYILGEHGGSAFLIVYIAATLLLSLPVFVAEVTIGRRSRRSAYGAMAALESGRRWKIAGALSVFIPLFILCYYSVIGGWSLDFLFKSVTNQFIRQTSEEVTGLFGSFITSTWEPIIMHLAFLAICTAIIAKGVKSGIEKFSKYTIPVLFVLIVVMIVYSATLPGSMDGFRYLLDPDFSQLDAKTFVYALGQSFYSMSLGMGAIVTYGSYVKKKENIVATSVGTAISDMLFAILAGMAIMPAVFAAGMEPGAGPGLVFCSVPYIFSTMGAISPILSSLVAVLFFVAILAAAATSCISLQEVGVSYFVEHRGMTRKKAAWLLFAICGSLGVVCSLSFGPLSGVTLVGKNIFDLFDWFASNVLLLTLGFIVAVFVGFVMKKEDVKDEITNGGTNRATGWIFEVVYFLIKWVAPIGILGIFVTNFLI